jgi:hypothetical protein
LDISWHCFNHFISYIFWRRQNAVWGGFTTGIIIGFIIALFSEFRWYIVGRGAILGTMIGFVAELLGMLSDFLKRKV